MINIILLARSLSYGSDKVYFYHTFSCLGLGPLGNGSIWDNWFRLWAYAPNFWHDADDLDLMESAMRDNPVAEAWGWSPTRVWRWWNQRSPSDTAWEMVWANDCQFGRADPWTLRYIKLAYFYLFELFLFKIKSSTFNAKKYQILKHTKLSKFLI